MIKMDNKIKINENDDSFSLINYNKYNNNQRNKSKHILIKNNSNSTNTIQEQQSIINDNLDSNYSYLKMIISYPITVCSKY